MTDKTSKQAIALHYDQVHAPRVSAKGSGGTAEQIIAIAKQHDIPLVENAEMLSLLSEVSLNEEIPKTLFLCVAGIIAIAYKVRGKTPSGWQPCEEDDDFKDDEGE